MNNQWERRRVILLCGLNHLEVKTLTNRAFRSFTLTLGRKVYTDRAAKSASSRGHAVPLLLQDVSGCASDGDESRDRGLCVILESLIICRTFLWTAVLPRDYRGDRAKNLTSRSVRTREATGDRQENRALVPMTRPLLLSIHRLQEVLDL